MAVTMKFTTGHRPQAVSFARVLTSYGWDVDVHADPSAVGTNASILIEASSMDGNPEQAVQAMVNFSTVSEVPGP